MSTPLVTSDDLGLYLNDPTINVARAEAMIADAQTLCETILAPLPPAAAVVVKRVAARGYVTTTTARSGHIASAGSPFGGMGASSGSSAMAGGIWLTRGDKADLRRLSGGGAAFTINLLATDYTLPALPPWDVQAIEGS